MLILGSPKRQRGRSSLALRAPNHWRRGVDSLLVALATLALLRLQRLLLLLHRRLGFLDALLVLLLCGLHLGGHRHLAAFAATAPGDKQYYRYPQNLLHRMHGPLLGKMPRVRRKHWRELLLPTRSVSEGHRNSLADASGW